MVQTANALRRIKAVPAGRGILSTKETPMRTVSIGLAALLCGMMPAAAQDVEAGHRLAAMWCSSCHQIEAAARGPLRDTPPSFGVVARMSSTTRMSLTVFLSTPHYPMPNYSLSRQEIADVSAYILSLKPEDVRN